MAVLCAKQGETPASYIWKLNDVVNRAELPRAGRQPPCIASLAKKIARPHTPPRAHAPEIEYSNIYE